MDDVAGEGNDVMQRLQQMEKLMHMQMQMMQLNIQNAQGTPLPTQGDNTLADAWTTQATFARKQVRQVKVPEGRHDMSLTEFRTYRKDCKDYAFLTQQYK